MDENSNYSAFASKEIEGPAAIFMAIGDWIGNNYSLTPNLFAMIGRTSSASTKVSKKGSNEISARSDGSSNQLLIGIPLSTCNRKTWNYKERAELQ